MADNKPRYRCEDVQNIQYLIANLPERDKIVSVYSQQISRRDMGEIEHYWTVRAVIEIDGHECRHDWDNSGFSMNGPTRTCRLCGEWQRD